VPLTTAVTTTACRDFNFASTQCNAGRIAGVAENNRDYPRRTRPVIPHDDNDNAGSRCTTKYNLIIWPARTRFPAQSAAPRNAQLRSVCATTYGARRLHLHYGRVCIYGRVGPPPPPPPPVAVSSIAWGAPHLNAAPYDAASITRPIARWNR